MNNTISVYELLGLIKDGKAPKLVKYDNYIWEYKKQFDDYFNDEEYLIENGFDSWNNAKYFLEEKVEIIEEKTIQENISRLSYQQIGTYQLDNNDILGFIKALNEQFTKHGRKINEIVDYINKEEVDKR